MELWEQYRFVWKMYGKVKLTIVVGGKNNGYLLSPNTLCTWLQSLFSTPQSRLQQLTFNQTPFKLLISLVIALMYAHSCV
jgi:hypothetical protein